ncbi:hypothetical protein CCMA1212_008694 [Trichoderma ghanense]|uniref:Uncharacterized protein n=1 Tax=Trichoderma ghanense TaxID=65468 RepID=A0ABY2GTX7_9HYPO
MPRTPYFGSFPFQPKAIGEEIIRRPDLPPRRGSKTGQQVSVIHPDSAIRLSVRLIAPFASTLAAVPPRRTRPGTEYSLSVALRAALVRPEHQHRVRSTTDRRTGFSGVPEALALEHSAGPPVA